MLYIRIAWRIIRQLSLCTFIVLASVTWAALIVKYALGSGRKDKVQKKNLHMIRSVSKTIQRTVKILQK